VREAADARCWRTRILCRMDAQAIYDGITGVLAGVAALGSAFEIAIAVAGLIAVLVALLPAARPYRGWVLGVLAALLLAGEGVLARLHVQLYQLMVVVDPVTGLTSGKVAAPLWIESEKLYVWALIVAVMGLLMRRQRDELLSGVLLATGVLAIGGTLLSHPFTDPLPGLVGQYVGYLQGMAQGGQAADGAFRGMESARQFYYNAWFMWVHPPLLFFSYGAFVISFVATLQMIRERHSAFETTAYRWARIGYLSLTAGMLLGFPWALMSWQGESWWWSGKVNMSIMMWVLYTAYLHARLYLRTRGMWKAVAAIAVLSFLILVLTYVATYVVPGAHSYASAEMGRALAALAGGAT
jgi:ABC-type transport system involved in cytochrome c biogenesis permease subunit